MLKLHQILKSSRAAIDLASIMVGVIIIGLIGGVIAASVFAVIPWSQDNAAKQQLDSIRTAENAIYGVSSDSQNTVKDPAKNNSYGSSEALQANDLLQQSSTYCVNPSADGKSYMAYVKSGSGVVFTMTDKMQNPVSVDNGELPCTAGVYDPAKADDDGTVLPIGTTKAITLGQDQLTDATVMSPYSAQLTAKGSGTITFTATGVPAGLTLTPAGMLSGTPTAVGTFNIAVTATNGKTTATATYPLLVSGIANYVETFDDANYANRGMTAGGALYYWADYSNNWSSRVNFGVVNGQLSVYNTYVDCAGCDIRSARISMNLKNFKPNTNYQFSINSTYSVGGVNDVFKVAGANQTYAAGKTYTWTAKTTATGTYSFYVGPSTTYNQSRFNLSVDNLKATAL
jgi:hypothetical protein